MTFGALPVYAADDPLTVVNNLSDFIFGLIRAVGMILLGFGIVTNWSFFKEPRSQSEGEWVFNTCRRM